MSTWQKITAELGEMEAALVAVSKTRTDEQIMDLYDLGQRVFGENRVQELVEKQGRLPKDIRWHAIGHLQRNKVKPIASFVEMIHSVDSMRLCQEIAKQAASNEREIKILLQVKIAQEESKYGIAPEALVDFCKSLQAENYAYLTPAGIMGMATFTDDQKQIRAEFRLLKQLFDRVKNDVFSEQESFKEISMGMSGDYKIALEEGSTVVRIGSLLFS